MNWLDCNALAGKFLQFQETRASSVTLVLNSDDSNMGNVIGYMLWHRKADDKDYPSEPTCRLFAPDTKVLLSNLSPSTEYLLKVAVLDKNREIGSREFQFRTEASEEEVQNLNSKIEERSESPATNCSSLSNPSSVEDENNTADRTVPLNVPVNDNGSSNPPKNEGNNGSGDVISLLDEEQHTLEKSSSQNNEKAEMSNDHGPQAGLECVPYQARPHIETNNAKEGGGRKKRCKNDDKGIIDISQRDEEPQAGSSSKKRSGERGEEGCLGIGDKDFEYYVKVVRWLECEGHIDAAFRQKFLTWYSLRASPQEVRIVKVFIDTFIEDPSSLAGQLEDTFNDVVSNKSCSRVRSGFCLKLWH